MSDVERVGTVVGIGALVLGLCRLIVPLVHRLIDGRERQEIRAEVALAERLSAAELRIAEIEALAVRLAEDRAELARKVAAYEAAHGPR